MGGIGKFDKNIPRIAPRPEPSETFRQNIQCLDGIWEFCHRSKEEVCKSDGPAEGNNWNCIEVPSFISATADRAEGFTGVYSYRRTISLLLEWEDTVKILKFEGINGHAKVYVDEKLTGEHRNGFLTWTMDITEACRGKKQITLQVDVEELTERIGTFYHGGIIHSTWLYLLPKTYISMLHMSVSLDEEYKDAVLTTDYSVQASLPDCMAEGTLLDPFGMVVPEGGFCKSLSGSEIDERVSVKILSPLLWDAEHPRLYTMCIRICQGGAVLETVEKKFGFRQIERRANQVFVNGREVKLRGVCRHEVSALHGRCITPELIERDVKLFKEANCNYIRTSHYSPSEYFLDVCDREGIYVEDELGLAFIAKNTDFTQRDPGETERFFSHFREAMARDYSHPCVLIWSLCNESFGGYNFDQLNRLVHETDPTRLTKFSYPMTMQLEHEPVDVWSIHYTNQDVDLSEKRDNVSVGAAEGKDVPVLHDEYAHIPCYNREEHRRDPNVRNFWGESIKRFWDKIWNTKGALLQHCGPWPISVARETPKLTYPLAFSHPGSITAEAKHGEVTLARFDGDNGEYSMLLGKAKGVDGPKGMGTYLWVEVENIKRLEAKIVEGPYIHHCVGIHKDVVPVLYEACKYMGITPDLYDPIEEDVKAYLRGE